MTWTAVISACPAPCDEGNWNEFWRDTDLWVPDNRARNSLSKGSPPRLIGIEIIDKRPILLKLGGEDCFADYQREFNHLYHEAIVSDVLDRRVEFRADACHHVCFKAPRDSVSSDRRRTVWSQERAERLAWIKLALMTPQQIRPDHKMPRSEVYLLTIPAAPEERQRQGRYCVYVELTEEKGRVIFCTAFRMEERYWEDARNYGGRIYPPPRPKKPSGKRKKKGGSRMTSAPD